MMSFFLFLYFTNCQNITYNMYDMKTRNLLSLLMLVLLSSCSLEKPQEVQPASIVCKNDIKVPQNQQIDINEYCIIEPENAVVSTNKELTSSDLGKYEVELLISDGKHNNFTTAIFEYEVIESIPTVENATYDESTKTYICNEGYVNMGKDGETICELITICEDGYKYDETTNSCSMVAIPSQTSQTQNSNSAVNSTPEQSQESGPPPQTPVQEPPTQSEPTPAPAPEPAPAQSTSGSTSCTPAGNSQEALDEAYSACIAECSGHGNCQVSWNGSAYVAEWY